MAQDLAHPHSLASALSFAAMLHQFRREAPAAQALAAATVEPAPPSRGLAQWLARGTFLRGWTLRRKDKALTAWHRMRQKRPGELPGDGISARPAVPPWRSCKLSRCRESARRVDEG